MTSDPDVRGQGSWLRGPHAGGAAAGWFVVEAAVGDLDDHLGDDDEQRQAQHHPGGHAAAAAPGGHHSTQTSTAAKTSGITMSGQGNGRSMYHQ
jgi:hypothetical protein